MATSFHSTGTHDPLNVALTWNLPKKASHVNYPDDYSVSKSDAILEASPPTPQAV